MKKFLLLGCVALALSFVSCKSTDVETPAEETTETVADQTSEEVTAEEIPQEDNGNGDLADALSQADAARNEAIASGADKNFADAFAALDSQLETIRSANDGKDHSGELKEIKAKYDALAKASKALKLKERIDSEQLADNDRASYDKGENAKDEFNKLLSDGADGKSLLSKAGEMYDSYYAVFFTAYKKLADSERKLAVQEKKNADSVKAQIARKAEYTEYAELIKKGDSHYVTKNPEEAYNSYKKAHESFAALYADVSAKRAAAQKAIDEAKAKIKEADEYAAEADVEKPLGEEAVEGIEEEGTILLEKDSFANPDDAVIEVESESELDKRAEKEGK